MSWFGKRDPGHGDEAMNPTPKDLFLRSLAVLLQEEAGTKILMAALLKQEGKKRNAAHTLTEHWTNTRVLSPLGEINITVDEAEAQLREFLK